jgi:hypothetical protein
MKLSPHFTLAEFLRVPPSEVPIGALEALDRLVTTLLEPARVALGYPLVIRSGYRTFEHNARVGGAKFSDHLHGRAADVHGAATDGATWEENTQRLFDWLREHKLMRIGQLIFEDHRVVRKSSTALWVHVSIPSPRHPGAGDGNQLLVSFGPGEYRRWSETLGGTA